MSSEARSTGGTLTSVTRKTIHSLAPAPAACPTPSLAVRKAAVTASAGTPGRAASRLDLVLDLVKAPFARRRDAENIVPDIAVVERDGVVVDTHIAAKGLRDDIETAGNVGHQLPVGKTAGAIDRVDGDGGKPKFLRGLDDACATAALVFHLVAQIGDRFARAFHRNFLLQIGGDAFI